MRKNSVKAAGFAALLALLFLAVPMPALAGAPEFSCTAQTDKAAYYIGEDVTINFELKWQYLTQNYTLNVELWNSTVKVADLESGRLVDGTHNPNGTYTASYTVSDLTDEAGSETYIVKVIDSSSQLVVASAQIQVVVQSRTIYMSVAWDDASGDRKIDTGESVQFTVYITWTFANESESLSLKVNDQGVEKLIDVVGISPGSGSTQKTYVTTFENTGTKILSFWLEDSGGKHVVSKSVSVNVGTAETAQTSWIDKITQAIYENRYVVIVFLALLVAALVLVKYR